MDFKKSVSSGSYISLGNSPANHFSGENGCYGSFLAAMLMFLAGGPVWGQIALVVHRQPALCGDYSNLLGIITGLQVTQQHFFLLFPSGPSQNTEQMASRKSPSVLCQMPLLLLGLFPCAFSGRQGTETRGFPTGRCIWSGVGRINFLFFSSFHPDQDSGKNTEAVFFENVVVTLPRTDVV